MVILLGSSVDQKEINKNFHLPSVILPTIVGWKKPLRRVGRRASAMVDSSLLQWIQTPSRYRVRGWILRLGVDSLSSHLFFWGKSHWDVWKILSTMAKIMWSWLKIHLFSFRKLFGRIEGPCHCWCFPGGLRVTNLQVYKTYTCEVVCNLRGHQSKVPPVWWVQGNEFLKVLVGFGGEASGEKWKLCWWLLVRNERNYVTGLMTAMVSLIFLKISRRRLETRATAFPNVSTSG